MPDALPSSGQREQPSLRRAGGRAVRVSPELKSGGSPDGSLTGALVGEGAIRVIPADENAMIEQYGVMTIAAATI